MKEVTGIAPRVVVIEFDRELLETLIRRFNEIDREYEFSYQEYEPGKAIMFGEKRA